mmetsp:Transcript_10995/g.26396  ORF Transcript_10995/g.26396 Transcript_10995/m.26396 type:complete len:229 (+) Transcript_10995:103-789(+)
MASFALRRLSGSRWRSAISKLFAPAGTHSPTTAVKPARIRRWSCSIDGATKAGRPCIASKSSPPKAHMSTGAPRKPPSGAARCEITSGAMYSGVPTAFFSLRSAQCTAKPKSHSRQCRLWASSTLEGLRSRWAMPSVWRWERALESCAASRRASTTGSPGRPRSAWREIRRWRLPPPQYCSASCTPMGPVCSATKLAMCGWLDGLSRRSTATSRSRPSASAPTHLAAS